MISQTHYGIYHNKPLSLINACPAFKKKRWPTAAKMSSGHEDFVIFPTFCQKNISFIGPINFCGQGHLLEWIWLFGFDIKKKKKKKKKTEAPFCLFYMLCYH